MSQKQVKLPPIYFDSRSGAYWLQAGPKRFLQLDGRNCKLHMMRAGFYVDVANDHGLKSGDSHLIEQQLNNAVDYAGPLAGHPIGLVETSGGRRVLVTEEARTIEPTKGDCPRMESLLGQLLPGEQSTRFIYWLKCALVAQRERDFAPGQLSVFAGGPGCGKSLLQALVTEILGGRCAKPFRYMVGETSFNADLMASEHLAIEDENASSAITARRKFGASIKDWTVNVTKSLHAKGKEAISLPTFHRLTLSVNSEPENMMILPPLDSSLLDKINLFSCSKAELPADEKRAATWGGFLAELPAFVGQVMRTPIPKKLRCKRFGVVAFHHEELLAMLDDISPEQRLESLIEQVIFTKDLEFWRGTSEELESELRKSAFAFAVEKLLYFASACGVYLARLAAKHPSRFEARKNKGRTVWMLKPQQREEK